MLKELHIFDCDGVLVDSTHRYRTTPDGKIDLPYWRENSHKAMLDKLLPMAQVYRSLLQNPETFVSIATARVMGKADWQFFETKLDKPQYFVYRQPHDTRRGAEMKLAGLRKLLNLKQFRTLKSIHVYEDNVDYLKGLCDNLPNAIGHYIPSKQGH